MPDVHMKDTIYSAIEDSHAVVIVTEWDAFRALDIAKVADMMAGDVLVDLRNIYEPEDVERCGLRYSSIGR